MSVTKESKFVAFFRSEVYIMLTLITITIPVMVHTANLLLQLSSVQNPYYAFFFAFGFDLAIFTFAVNGRKRAAGGLALIVLFLNICYFNLDLFYENYGISQVKLIITIVLASSTAFILHSYVMFFNNIQEKKDRMLELETDSYKKSDRINELEGLVNRKQSEVDKLKVAAVELSALKETHESTKRELEAVKQVTETRRTVDSILKTIKYPYKCENSECGQVFTDESNHQALKKHCKFCIFDNKNGAAGVSEPILKVNS